MASLYKKEILVKPNSNLDFDNAMSKSLDWLTNTFQNKPENKDKNGNDIDFFFADVYFADGHFTNSGQIWRLYTNACQTGYGLSPKETGRIEFLLMDKKGVDTEINNLVSKTQEQDSRLNALENSNGSVEATAI